MADLLVIIHSFIHPLIDIILFNQWYSGEQFVFFWKYFFYSAVVQ